MLRGVGTSEPNSGKIKMTEAKTINASLHGHVLAKFNDYWKKAYNCRNISETLFNTCVKKNIGLYAISDDEYGNVNGVSRFEQIWGEALPNKELKKEKLDENAFVMSKGDDIVYFLNGQSTEVSDKKRKYEIVTFGKNTPKFKSFNEMKKAFNGEGLISILEHPLAEGHHGALSKHEVIGLLMYKEVDAIEFNSKIAVPNSFSFVPVLNGFTRDKNERVVTIAESMKVPVVANDDSDTPLQIGHAYTIFPREEINFTNGETITRDLNSLILDNNFSIHKGYESFVPWFKYAVRAKLKG